MPASDAFVELFVGRRFTSLAEFEETLSEYMKANFVNFVVATSVRTANSRLRSLIDVCIVQEEEVKVKE
ncbi:hypothetical protein PHET_09573 [Paragonimus heterotremus]|uniref:Uncharacterized protein n=1 Tax=Paragonimus heterotremus TaxID=100268 RepID=A0A8J4T3A5_9TREM|nr:hypothetical protein PHET_09573 [Paragonimus heterotremus]KAF6772550.1 hypothetical protein AHF37_08553 [Paragonimus kellicotti]